MSDMKEMYEKGRNDGYAEGYAKGNHQGFNEGNRKGYNEGYADAYNQDEYCKGYATGIEDARIQIEKKVYDKLGIELCELDDEENKWQKITGRHYDRGYNVGREKGYGKGFGDGLMEGRGFDYNKFISMMKKRIKDSYKEGYGTE